MNVFQLLPSPGVRDGFASKKVLRPKPRIIECACGCGRRSWFTQPRSLRAAPQNTALTSSETSPHNNLELQFLV